jgi:hypothetical protein
MSDDQKPDQSYVPAEYPKMPSAQVKHANGGTATVPLYYPYGVGHPKEGELVIFKDEEEEAAYYAAGAVGVPSSHVSDVVENRNHPSYKR